MERSKKNNKITTSFFFKKKFFFGIVVLFTFCKTPDKQKVEAILSSEKEIYILDTVSIIEPVLVEFEDTLALTNEFMILSSSEFDSIVRMKPKIAFQDAINSGGYLYFNHIDFLKVLERLLLEENCDLYNLYYGRYSKFNETGRTIVSYNLETREGWKFYRIDQTKFIFCLVKGSFYQFCCQSDENILLNDGNNIYYKVVVPIVLDL